MPAHDPKTLQFYATEAPDYHARGPGGVNRDLPRFLEDLVPGTTILELERSADNLNRRIPAGLDL